MIAIVTDSNSQAPPSLVERFQLTVVPLTVTVDGRDYLEGVDLDADEFYARFERGVPSVTTAQPSPGQFADAYRALAAAGAEEILSVHIGSNVSGTVNSARLGAATAEIGVRIVDTGTASFAVTLCTWAAAEAAARGASLEEAAEAAERTAKSVGNVFAVRTLDLARAGGRLAPDASEDQSIPVLTIVDGVMHVLGRALDLEEVADVVADHVRGAGDELRVGIGVADAAVIPFWDLVEQRLAGAPQVAQLLRYCVGPSVGAHTGPGTVGAMYAAFG